MRANVFQGQENKGVYDSPCTRNVQPVAAIEIAEGTVGWPMLRDILQTNGHAEVVVEGTLRGPECRPMPSGMPLDQYAEWMNPCLRYGYGNSFRSMLEVTKVISAEPTKLVEVPFWPPTGPQYPALVSGEVPQYPEAARVLEIAGTVELDVSLESGAVTNVIVISGEQRLAAAALRTVKTWKFVNTTTTFRTTFIFELERRAIDENQNSRVELEIPKRVRIVATINKW